jgi:molecular chaperone GrpE
VSDLNPTYFRNQELRDLLIENLGNVGKENVVLQESLREEQTKNTAERENLFLELLEVADALEALLDYLHNNPKAQSRIYRTPTPFHSRS